VDILAFLLILALLGFVVWLVSGPLRTGRATVERESARVEELEAARDSKYREIRDAELDYRTGKLSEADWKRVDRALRAEAIEILRGLDEARGEGERAG
jgi:hypothetical protein